MSAALSWCGPMGTWPGARMRCPPIRWRSPTLTGSSPPKNVAVPLINIGPIYASGRNLNLTQSYTLELVSGDPISGMVQPIGNATLGGSTFYKPIDNIGKKSIANYAAYAQNFVYEITIPGCAKAGRGYNPNPRLERVW